MGLAVVGLSDHQQESCHYIREVTGWAESKFRLSVLEERQLSGEDGLGLKVWAKARAGGLSNTIRVEVLG